MPLLMAFVLTSRRRLARRLRRGTTTTNGCCFRDEGDARERDACEEAFVVANDDVAAITFPREEESRKEAEDMRRRKSDEKLYALCVLSCL